MAQDTLLGFPAHTLPYRRGEFTTLSTVSLYRICAKKVRIPPDVIPHFCISERPIRLGQGGFLRYLAAMVVVHHFLFFMLESLSWAQLFHTLVRLVVSGAVTVGFIWLLARLFTTKLTVRL